MNGPIKRKRIIRLVVLTALKKKRERLKTSWGSKAGQTPPRKK